MISMIDWMNENIQNIEARVVGGSKLWLIHTTYDTISIGYTLKEAVENEFYDLGVIYDVI